MSINKNYTKIPNEIIYDSKITSAEFRTYVAFLSFGWGNNAIYPSQATVAKRIGLTDRAVRNHLKSLKEKGYVIYKRRGFNMSNVYNFLTERNNPSSIVGTTTPDKQTSNKTINNHNMEISSKKLESIKDIIKRKEMP